ncbi:PLP-dependent aminotransferase family protein [Massilia sp. IC2-477]|uniref:MocR-like pyridoxine biosynthesis transcription factor PdxR n=1 Tax=Massilia sp. IC2-477 TaxID=2887198 RepID=UPI001D107E5B|nr:PLP-dependent aminotransferase family protein [Massilia sp. IC2-477]MCC2957776.1 PLP-dependent aminotransferase family protein [Massilia sp. IC2-477]
MSVPIMLIHELIAAAPLERTAAIPLFRQLYARLKDAILHGRLAPGARLPPTRELAQQLQVSRQTVLAAYEQLTAEGYLRGGVGQGTFVDAALPAARQEHTAAGAAPDLLRPLPARGAALATSMARVRHHQGELRTFRPSMPGLDLFPFETWRKLEAHHWRRRALPLGYGAAAGHAPLRELLCAYLNASRGVRCTPEQVIMTTGSQQALYLLAQLLLAPGDGVWLESPGYQGAAAPFEVAGARMCLVPVDEEGMDVAHAAARYPDAAMVFATPSHQLPLGVTMSLARRLELLRWAQAKRAWIVEDDYDSEYRYTGPPLASLQSLDRAGCVIYIGTFSKVLFPGLRLGYVVAPPALAGALAQAKAVVDRHSPIVPQAVLADFIRQGHFARHIRRTREAYAERRAAMLEALDQHLGGMLACGPSDAGLDLCLHFTGHGDEAQAVARAAAAGVEVRPLSYFAHPQAGPACAVPPGMLLGFSAFTPQQIRAGVAQLAQALKA